MGSVEFVFQLPSKAFFDLAEILDPDKGWLEVARAMPDISPYDIDACLRSESPTETLIRIWGSKGYRVLDLFKVFGSTLIVKGMKILHPYIDSEFHRITETCVQHKPFLSPKAAHEPLSVVRTEITQPSTVYSKKATSIAEIPASNGGESTVSTDVMHGLHSTLKVTYEDILTATENFADTNICGRGGYGVVYRGVYKHMDVAIKRIRIQREGGQNRESIRQIFQELQSLSKFRHDNILPLYGFSMDGAEPCLICQFMPNGSLEDRILCRDNSTPLPWLTRLMISKGVSMGLHFLHSATQKPFIHGDVKSANILLNKHMEPRLGDFGLSRDSQVDVSDNSPMIASHIKGTLAYLPPEFTRHKHLSPKLDVYSFGVVLLELATGLRAYSAVRQPHSLVAYVSKIVRDPHGAFAVDKRVFTELADRRLTEKSNGNEADGPRMDAFKMILNYGIKCTAENPSDRPDFNDVISDINKVIGQNA